MNKRIETIPHETMEALVALRLAGQRAGTGESDRAGGHPDARHQPSRSRWPNCARRRTSRTPITLEDAERDHIRRVLEQANGWWAGRMEPRPAWA